MELPDSLVGLAGAAGVGPCEDEPLDEDSLEGASLEGAPEPAEDSPEDGEEDEDGGELCADEDSLFVDVCASDACGACSGGLSEPLPVPEELPLLDFAELARLAALEPEWIVLPGNALAATSDSSAVTATLPAISQRLMCDSLRSASSRTSLVCLGMVGLVEIEVCDAALRKRRGSRVGREHVVQCVSLQ